MMFSRYGIYRIFTAVWLAMFAAPASAADRALTGVALVIGQSEYEHLAPLPNPERDADAIDDLLSDLGFDVTGVSSADHKKLSRALDRFVEDAADADVALIYYSGHGIEAGGENFLVPVDADISALDAARDRLVPMSEVLAALQKAVPVTILLLDACRDNPFPPGAMVRLDHTSPAVAPATAGLSAPRGATALGKANDPTSESFGSVIGFAASPGRVAFDGAPGSNSPYAAALIKHLSAGGYSFGDVMTMVSEKVWLKTRAAQTPWTNTSLRRQLEFGARPPAPASEEEAAIRGERRDLLLRISKFGQAERLQVAARAEEGGVPMDALFALLTAVGSEAPEDPEQLDALLKQQAERLKEILADRAVVETTDQELVQLASLADEAIGEGALNSAIALNERAKLRVRELSSTLDAAEAQLARRRAEFAAVYAKSAQTYALAGDYAAAAADYGRAFAEIERWDEALAWRYRAGEANALNWLGHYGADNGALARSVETWKRALEIAPRDKRPLDWAASQAGLGAALWTQGDRLGVRADSEAAIEALRASLEEYDRPTHPGEWADAQSLLGAVLLTTGLQDTGKERLLLARDALTAAAEVRTRDAAPAEWSRIQNRLGLSIYALGTRDPGTELLHQALGVFDDTLKVRTRDGTPMDWAQTQNNRALVLSTLGQRTGDAALLHAAVDAYRGAAEVQTRDRTPILWAETMANIGNVLWLLSNRESGTERAAQSAEAFRAALEVVSRDKSPLRWAALQDNLALALKTIGERRGDEAMVEEAIVAYHAALEERTRERVPFEWASTSVNLANALYALGYYRKDAAMLREAVAMFRASIEVNTRQLMPLEWARNMNNVGLALHALGTLTTDASALDEAATAYRSSALENTRERVPVDWGQTQYNLSRVLLDLGRFRADREMLAQALEAALASREVYLAAGMQNFASVFDNLELEIRLADLQADVAQKLKTLQAEQGAPAVAPKP